MLFGFLGAPCSGKTTTAVRVFSTLKEWNQPVEFVAESARHYIATKKLQCKRSGETLVLSDEDQLAIAGEQLDVEKTMVEACGPDTVVISDSSALNSLLYMSPEFKRTNSNVAAMTRAALRQYSGLFISGIVPFSRVPDPNRVHDEEECSTLNEQVFRLAEQVADGDFDVFVPTWHLFGVSSYRTHDALEAIRQVWTEHWIHAPSP